MKTRISTAAPYLIHFLWANTYSNWLIFVLGGLLLSSAAGTSSAAESQDYFRANIPVKSQTSKARFDAYETAFMDVIYRISGFKRALSDPSIRQAAKKANTFVVQYQYLPLKSEALKEEGYSVMLSMKFSEAGVLKVLRDAQQAMWSNRPDTLVWLVEDDPEEGKQLLNQQRNSTVVASLNAAAKRRGLPLQYPLLDLDDQLALSAEDVWSANEEAIMRASERYGADVVLVGRYSKTSRGELWSIWQFFHAGATRNYDSRVTLAQDALAEDAFSLEAESFNNLGSSALDPLADFLAERYAIRPQLEAGGRLVVQVSGVESFGDYRQSLSYLEGLGAVSDVQIAAVRQDTMLLLLDSRADIDRLLKVLALDRKMRPQDSASQVGPVWQQAPRGTLENPLSLFWSS